jgi:hypothetical protein
MAQVMKPKDQKLTKPVLQRDQEDELPVPPPYIPSTLPPSEQPVPPLPDSLPPSVSPPQPHQQPSSPVMSHTQPWLGVQVHSPCALTFPHPRHWPLGPGPYKCYSVRCKGPSRLVLMTQSGLDALSSITSLSVQLAS